MISHLFNSIFGAALGSIGAIGLMIYLHDTPAVNRAVTGTVATVLGNTLTASVFGAAAFAQPAAGQMFLAGQQNALEFYNRVYAAPLFGTVLVGLLLFIIGGVFVGIAIATSGRFPRWAGWVYALGVIVFVLSNFLLPVGQSVAAVLLFAATVVVAWTVSRRVRPQEERIPVSP
ncbi:MAG TPA: hypothetical protein VFF68_00630 [Anaerolineaceae bacterium]|nr:hypothetical protein [Anaerolineaceae bacterium]